MRLGTNASKYFNVLFGVPQGSILGLLLFILYASNIVDIASKHGILIHNYISNSLPKTLLMLRFAYWLVSLIYKHGVHLCV